MVIDFGGAILGDLLLEGFILGKAMNDKLPSALKTAARCSAGKLDISIGIGRGLVHVHIVK